jgi:serine/threonine protein kinase/WD40 repeat protein
MPSSDPSEAGRPSLTAGRYLVSRELARGGMGAILEANDESLDREVAMKVMLDDAEQDQVARQRFLREALVLARLSHPNIVPIHDMGRDEQGRRFYTMKLVKGRTLQAILTAIKKGDELTTKHYTLDRLLTIYRKVCDAVAFAHHQRIIHRDLKPENVMVGEFGEVLVMDWGLAKHLDDEQHAKTEAARAQSIEGFNELSDAQLAAGAGNLTLEGAVMGSPQYMPPEQAEGRLADIGPHSDIYSLGGILYAILTLRHPVNGKSLSDVLSKVVTGDIPPPTTYNSMAAPTAKADDEVPDARKITGLPHCPGGKVPTSLSAVTMRAMALKPEARYTDVAALVADIEAYQGGFATSAEQVGAAGQFVLLVKRNKGASIAAATALAVIRVCRRPGGEGTRGRARGGHGHCREGKGAQSREGGARRVGSGAGRAGRGRVPRRRLSGDGAGAGGLPARRARLHLELLLRQARRLAGPAARAGVRAVRPPRRRARPAGAVRPGGGAGRRRLRGRHVQPAAAHGADRPGGPAPTSPPCPAGRAGLREIAFSGDGLVFAVRAGKEVGLHDTATGALRKSLTLPVEFGHQIALGHDGSVLAVISNGPAAAGRPEGRLTLIETATGRTRWQQRAAYYHAVAILPDGSRVIASSGGAARFYWVFDAADGRELARHPVYAMCQALHPDGKSIAIGTQQGEVLLVNTSTGAVLQQGKLHSGRLQAMAWTADGHLFTMGEEGKMHSGLWLFRLWDPEFLAPRATFAGLNPGPPVNWTLNPASGHLITVEGQPRVWRVPAGRERVRITQTSEQAFGGAFLADTVLLGRKSYELVRYDLATPGQAKELGGPRHTGTICAAHPAAGWFVVGPKIGSPPFIARLFAPEGAAIVEKLSLPLAGLVADLAFDAGGGRLAATLKNGTLEVFNVKDGKSLLRPAGRFEHAAFAGEAGHLVAVAPHTVKADAVEFHLRQLDGATGKMLATATNRFHVQTLAVSPNGQIVALGGSDRSVHLYDADTLREQPGFRAHDGDVGALTFHPTQPILATASSDGSVKLWDYRTGKLLDDFLGLAGNPVVLSFSPNGKLLMADGQERTTRVYDVAHLAARP